MPGDEASGLAGADDKGKSSGLVCACNDTACWKKDIAKHQVKATVCGVIAALTAGGELISGHYGHLVLELAECAVEGGASVDAVAKLGKSCNTGADAFKQLKCIADGLGAAAGGVGTVTTCTAAVVEGASKHTLAGVGHVATAIKCGLTTFDGSIKLAGQLGCTFSEVLAAYASSPDYKPETPLPRPSSQISGMCRGEPIGQANKQMLLYGYHLYNTRGGYITDAGARADCQKWCGNEGSKRCAEAIAGYGANGLTAPGVCFEVCRTAQSQGAIDGCVNACEKGLSNDEVQRAAGGEVTKIDFNEAKCNSEPLSCPTAWMTNYGKWLQKNTRAPTYDYVHCHSQCTGSYSDSENGLRWAARTGVIDSTGACAYIGQSSAPMCKNAVSGCISYCCLQDEACVRDAHARMK